MTKTEKEILRCAIMRSALAQHMRELGAAGNGRAKRRGGRAFYAALAGKRKHFRGGRPKKTSNSEQ